MSLLVLLKNRATGQPVVADDDDNEWLNIIDCLAGTSVNKSIRVRSNDNSFAVARFDQLGANDIIELFVNGVEIVRVEQTGKIKSLVATGTAPIDVDSTTKCPNLNADLLDGLDSTAFAQLGTHLIKHKETWFKKDPQDNNAPNDQSKVFIAPSGASMRITKFSIFRRGGSHTAGQNITWQAVKNGAGIGSGVSFTDTNNAINTEYSEALNISIAAGDWIGINNTALGGTAAEKDVSMLVEWEEKLTT